VGFLAPGGKLLINARTEDDGVVKIEVADLDGKALPGRSFEDGKPLSGDLYREAVTWKGVDTPQTEEKQAIMLRVRMERATVYSFDFG